MALSRTLYAFQTEIMQGSMEGREKSFQMPWRHSGSIVSYGRRFSQTSHPNLLFIISEASREITSHKLDNNPIGLENR